MFLIFLYFSVSSAAVTLLAPSAILKNKIFNVTVNVSKANVACTLTVGSSVKEFTVTSLPFQYVHQSAFPSNGVYQILAKCNNSYGDSGEITVEESLADFMIVGNNSKVVDFPNVATTISLLVNFSKAPNVTLLVIVNNVTSKTLHIPEGGKPTNVSLARTDFSGFGVHHVTLRAFNKVSSEDKNIIVYYEEPINCSDFSMPSHAVVDTNVSFNLSLTAGSNVILQWFTSDDNAISYYQKCMSIRQKFSISYRFAKTGTYNFTVEASNDISSCKRSATVTVSNDIKAFDLEVTPTVLEIDEKLNIVIYVSKNVILPIRFVNASITVSEKGTISTSLNDMSPGGNKTFTYSFHSFGNKNVLVEIRNPFQSSVVRKTIYMEERLSGTKLWINKTLVRTGEPIYISFLNFSRNGFNFSVDFGDNISISNTINKQNFTDTFFLLTKNYSASGVYLLSWKILNSLYSHNGSVYVTVLRPLKSLNLQKYNETLFIPFGLREFILTSDQAVLDDQITCDIEYGDGIAVSHPNMKFEPSSRVSIWHNYSAEGEYTTSISCYNNVSHLNVTATTIVRTFTVQDFTVNYPLVVGMNDTEEVNVTFLIELFGASKFPPNVVVAWDFGDHGPSEIEELTTFKKIHTFKRKCHCTAKLNITSRSETRTLLMNIQIGAITLKTYTFIGLANETEFLFSFLGARGNTTFKLFFKDNLPASTHSESASFQAPNAPIVHNVTHVFSCGGNYSVSAAVSNDTFAESLSTEQRVFVLNRLRGLKLSVKEAIEVSSSMVDVQLVYTSDPLPLYDVECIVWKNDSSGQTSKTFFGDILPRYDSVSIAVFTENLAIGDIHFSARCSNNFSTSYFRTTSKVISSCLSTGPLFEEKFRTEANAMQSFVSDNIRLNSRASVNESCAYLTVRYEWNISQAKAPVSFSRGNADSYFIGGNTLNPGLYRVGLSVSFGGNSNAARNDFMYLQLTQPPLVAVLSAGEIETIGSNGWIHLDAESLSYDPEQGRGETTNLTFLWSCKTSSKDIGAGVEVYAGILPSKAADDSSCPAIPEGGKANIEAATLNPNTWYVFGVNVTKDTRLATARRAVYVEKGNPIKIKVRCTLNCLNKISVNYDWNLETDLLDESVENKEKAVYQWKLFKNGETLIPDLHDLTRGGSNRSSLIIKKNILKSGVTYLLQLEVNIEGRDKGQTALVRTMNRPPEYGYCDIDPKEGKSTKTAFSVVCTNWTDQDSVVLRYNAKFQSGKKIFSLYEGVESNMPSFLLPQGDPDNNFQGTIIVQVIDIYLAYTEIRLPITVKSPLSINTSSLSPESMKEVQKIVGQFVSEIDANLQLTQRSGNVDKTIQIITSAASLFESMETPESSAGTFSTETLMSGGGSLFSSSSADKISENWNNILGSLTKKQENPFWDEMKNIMGNFTVVLCNTVNHNPPKDSNDILKVTSSVTQMLANPDLVRLQILDEVKRTLGTIINRLLQLTAKRPFEPVLLKAAETTLNLIGNLANMATPIQSPLSSAAEEMTMTKVRHAIEDSLKYSETGNDDSSSLHTSERAFLAFRDYQRKQVEINEKRKKSETLIPDLISVTVDLLNGLDAVMPTGNDMELDTSNLRISAAKENPHRLDGIKLGAGEENVQFRDLSRSNVSANPVTVSVLAFKKNPFVWDKSHKSAQISSSTVIVSLKGANRSRIPIKAVSLIASFKTPDSARAKIFHPKWTSGDQSKMFYIRFQYRSLDESVCIILAPFVKELGYEIFVRAGIYPTENAYAYRMAVAPVNLTGGVYSLCLDSGIITKAGPAFLGLKPFIAKSAAVSRVRRDSKSLELNISRNETDEDKLLSPYRLEVVTSSCLGWEDKSRSWKLLNCKVIIHVRNKELVCNCKNPSTTTFANTFNIAPNSIDFSTVFSRFDVLGNGAVFGVVLGLLAFYILIIIWARYQDRKDIVKWRVFPLLDNVEDSDNMYLMIVHTGLRRDAGTSSRVSFILVGDNGDSGIIRLHDGIRQKISTGSVNKYLLTVKEPLGDLQYLRIWHDNSGQGDNASWYLSKIEVVNIEHKQRCTFICNSWLAVEEAGGLLEKVIPVSGTENMLKFQAMFYEYSKQMLTNDHLWLSVLVRPSRSRFSRVQRSSCCMSLLCLTMITNAMFFHSKENVVRLDQFSIGPVRFSVSILCTSLLSILITTPPISVIMIIFQKSRLQPPKEGNRLGDQIRDKLATKQDSLSPPDRAPLPHCCVYISWILVVLSILISSFFVILYSFNWGKTKSEEWLSTFFMSFLESVVLIDPAKIVVLSLLFSIFSKELKRKTGKEEIDKNLIELNLVPYELVKEDTGPSNPLPKDLVLKARRKRLMELRMREVLRDIILYLLFVWITYSISFSNRDSRAFKMSEQIGNALIKSRVNFKGFSEVNSKKQLITWIKQVLFPNIFPQQNYNGKPMDWRSRLYFSDLSNFRLGPVRIRQVRIPGTEICDIPIIGRWSCRRSYSVFEEDTGDYCVGWTNTPCAKDQKAYHLTSSSWRFTPAGEIWGLPISGNYRMYGGGGYIAELDVNLQVSTEILNELIQHSWIDQRSRAVFVEFTLYNAHTNMFAHAIFLAEMPEVGGLLPYVSLYSFKTFRHVGSTSSYTLACEILFLVFMAVFFARVCTRLWHQRLAFFKTVWYVFDLAILAGCAIAVAMYIVRSLMTAAAIAKLTEDPKRFVNFYHVVVWDWSFVLLMAGLVFLCTIRFLRILGFNKRMHVVVQVITTSCSELLGFFCLLLIVIFAYSEASYLVFGRQLHEYRDFATSITTVFVSMIGKSSYRVMHQTNAVFAQLFFFSFTFMVLFVLLKMMEATLYSSILQVRIRQTREMDTYSLVKYFLRQFREILGQKNDMASTEIPKNFGSKDTGVFPNDLADCASASRDDLRTHRQFRKELNELQTCNW